ncbi:MAG TPA: extracellular solute-binding protein, partial [Saprospiraceae bacterium]|nr:extracellular solute-binding protein [Saprospiraceae bacterium]
MHIAIRQHWKISRFVLFAIAPMLIAVSCQKDEQRDHGLVFWSSTNTEEITFSKKYVAAWNQDHPDNPVSFQPVPEGQSSEEVILAAVVGRTTPDIYANMWQGDVEDFALSGVLVPLDTLDGFLQFLYERCDSQVVKEITSTNGHIYQIPWKVNPIMMEYNPGLFAKVGIDSIPQHYADYLAAGVKLKASNTFLGISESNAIWWQRFFNFLPLYYAASGGAPLIKDGKAVFNNQYGVQVFAFLQSLYGPEYFPKESLKGQRDPFLAQRV